MRLKYRKKATFILLSILVVIVLFLIFFPNKQNQLSANNLPTGKDSVKIVPDSIPFKEDTIKILNSSFLGGDKRNYYGNEAPSDLIVIWKTFLGSGKTVVSRSKGDVVWSGAGWTGQPLMIQEREKKYLIQGCYDHRLKKIDAETGKIIWQNEFDDVIKSTGTIWNNKKSDSLENRLVILQGSRLGCKNSIWSKLVLSYRAISYYSGKALWKINVKHTESYSRDCDGSAVIVNDTAYIGFENSLFTLLDPDYHHASLTDNVLQPKIYQETKLYDSIDVIKHKRNICTESSSCILNGIIYLSSGAGHVYGYSLKTKKIVWDFHTGSDLDGSTVVTSDSCILVPVERQYIPGKGGIFKLDPSKSPDSSVVWYFPTENKDFATWEGGIIGSPSINDRYNKGDLPYIAAFTAIDGNLYVVDHKSINGTVKVKGPNNIKLYNTPKLLFKYHSGPGISTPIIVNDKLIAAGYGGINLFNFTKDMHFTLIKKVPGSFEATPFAYDKRVYIASRDGFLYCFGEK